MSFTSSLDYSLLINNHPEIFIDFRQSFDIMYIIHNMLTDSFVSHKSDKTYFSIHCEYFKGKSRNLSYFNKIANFDKIFYSITDCKIFNNYTETTYGYKLIPEILIELLSYPKLIKPKTYVRDKFKVKKGYKKDTKVYKTKKELMQGEHLSRREVEKNIKDYSYEIRELAETRPRNYTNRLKFYSYEHTFEVDIDKSKALLQEFLDNGGETMHQPDAVSVYNLINKYGKDCKLKYQRKDGGRLVCFGGDEDSVNLQHLEKNIRNKVFEGFYEIDIENSAPSIMLQSAYKYTNLKLPTIEEYISKKEECRERLMDLGLSYKESKELHIAIFFGASLGEHGVYNKNMWSYRFGVEKIQYILENSPYFYNLYDEVRLMYSYLGKAIKNKFYKVNKKGKKILYNSRGNGSARFMDRYDNKKALMHYYFGIESMILDVIIKNYRHDLLLYDAFITKDDIDLTELEKLVKKEVNFDIKFSKHLIKGN